MDELKREVTLDTIYGDKKILILCINYFNCNVLISFLRDKDFNIKIFFYSISKVSLTFFINSGIFNFCVQ